METECSWLPAATVSSRRSFASTCSSSSSTSAQRAFTRHRTSCTTHTNNNNSNRSKSNSNKSSTHLTNTSRCLLSPSSSASSYFSSSASRASQLTASTGSYSNNSNSNKRHSSRVMSTYSSKSPAYCLSIHSIWWQCLLLLTCLLLTPSAVNAQYKPQWLDPMLAREIFVLNLEDGYFGCQVNESVDFLQLFELSKLCDGAPQCFRGSDELSVQLKCTDRSKYLLFFLSLHSPVYSCATTLNCHHSCIIFRDIEIICDHSSYTFMPFFGVRCIEKLI